MPVIRPVLLATVSAMALVLAACPELPRRDELIAQADRQGEIAFAVVKIDEAVVDVLMAQPRPAFRERFNEYLPAPELKIAVGDTVSVVIWEAADIGLFGNSLALPGTARVGERAGRAGRPGTAIPDQPVGADRTITIPYAGRVIAAGRSASELGRRIEALLAPIAIDPQAVVLVQRGAGTAVTVAGEAIRGARVPLSPGGTRLLDVIAAAGGATTPVPETFVRLSRDAVTAMVPLAVLVADPAQNIFARPGDVLVLSRAPQTFSVFGATGKNALTTFDTGHLSLAEALAKAGGLLDHSADLSAVFLMRYEPVELVHALGQPVAARAPPGVSPIVYRLDLGDAKSDLLATRFPVRDRDIIFVAEAQAVSITRALRLLSQVSGPVTTGFLGCGGTKC